MLPWDEEWAAQEFGQTTVDYDVVERPDDLAAASAALDRLEAGLCL